MSSAERDNSSSPLEFNRAQAVRSLDEYLHSPEEAVLREHQVDVIQSLHDFFSQGENSGYISLPTGSGKTILFVELVRALGLKTVILSPTKTILVQTKDAFHKFSPETKVGNYFQNEKDTTGDVISTTYQSFARLIESKAINPEDIGLLICDEAHNALGEQRHKIFRQVPNALKIGLTATPYFTPLEGYKQRGLVDENEPWADLFKNRIHEMSLAEAMQRGILASLEVHMVRTNATISSVDIQGGEYNQAQLERALNIEARNALTVGMVCGADKISSGKLGEKQSREIESIHNKIKDKRTVIFGLSIRHIEELAAAINSAGVRAEAVHSGLELGRRTEVLSKHASGEIPVILGVDVLREGWDSPQTEVGIYLAPTQSGIVAVQELGRILRPSVESGKENAIAVQLVDLFRYRRQTPILIPNVFDPYYVLRGSRTGLEIARSHPVSHRTGQPITFSGFEIESIVEEALYNEFLKTRFKSASVEEIAEIIDKIVLEAGKRTRMSAGLELYSEIADELPRLSPTKLNEAYQSMASIDSNVAEAGKKVLIFGSLRIALKAVQPYFSDNSAENDEIFQTALAGIVEKMPGFSPKMTPYQNIYNAAERSVASHIAICEDMPLELVMSGRHKEIKQRVSELIAEGGGGIFRQEAEKAAGLLAAEFNVSTFALVQYIQGQSSKIVEEVVGEDEFLREVYRLFLTEATEDMLASLTPRSQKVLELRYGLRGEKEGILDEIGMVFNVGRERIRQIEAKALRTLRRPSGSRRLRPFLESYWELAMPYGPISPHEEEESVLSLGPWKRWVDELSLDITAPTRREDAYRLFIRSPLARQWVREYHESVKQSPAIRVFVPIKEEAEAQELPVELAKWKQREEVVESPWRKWVEDHPIPEGASTSEANRYREFLKFQKQKKSE